MNKPKKILIVEDDSNLLSIFSLIFKKAAYNVITAENGEDAIELFKNEHPDVIVLDLMLPDISGAEVLKRIKSIDKNIPAIVCSATTDVDLTVVAMKAGACDYVKKPFKVEDLLEKVDKALAVSKHEEQVPAGKIEGRKKPIPILPLTGGLVILSAIILLVSKPDLFHKKQQEVFYKLPYAHPTALAWEKTGFLWVSDWYGQVIYRHKITDDSLPLIKAHSIPNSCFTGLTFGRRYLWSCDSIEKKIYLHIIDDKLSITKSYTTPGTSPAGLFFDGQNIWSCDNDTDAIYKHKLDAQLSVINTYKSPGHNPVGIFIYDKNIYSADADTCEIYKHKFDEHLSVVSKYKLDIFPSKIAGITCDGKYIWVSIDNEAKICKYDLKKLLK